MLQIPSPWDDRRLIFIAVGQDLLQAKAAAEKTLDQILADETVGPAAISREELRSRTEQIQWLTVGEDVGGEPDMEALAIDVDARTRRTISAEEAAEDVARFFTLLTHGYCGYGFFRERGDFDAAEAAILSELQSRSRWSTSDLPPLIHRHLDFIHDCHLKLGQEPFCQHQDFWYDTGLDVSLSDAGYSFASDGATYTVQSINGSDPAAHLFPSLTLEGDPMYRLGTLSAGEPAPLQVTARRGDDLRTFEVKLRRSDPYAGDRFDSRRRGGVPVVRAGSFGDYYGRELTEFLETADTYRDEPYAVVDLRGNGGGNTNWPYEWIRRFTGQSPAFRHVLTELISRTTRVGRANLFRQAVATVRKEDKPRAEADLRRYQAEAERFEDPAKEAYWTELQIPSESTIANDGTLVVIFDREVASAGEGMLLYLHQQVENVLFVGENSLGALNFGQVTAHQLPHSKLPVILSVKLNLSMDLEFREEIGYTPDLWVAVPPGYFDHPLTRENSLWRKLRRQLTRVKELALPILSFGAGLAMIFGLRKKPQILFAVAGTCLLIGAIALSRANWTPGFLLGGQGLLSMALGLYRLWQMRRADDVQSG